MRRIEAITLLAAATLATKVARAQEEGPRGQTFTPSLPSAPYPHKSRANGHTYQGVLYDAAHHYSDSTVGIYVPPQFQPSPSIGMIVHFHGWRNDVAGVFARYKLREQLDASGINAVLVVPQGPKDAPDSDFGKLELDQDGFARFVRDVLAFLNRNGFPTVARPREIVLTAHSGGYGGEGGVLTRGGMNEVISDVILFDAAYGYYDSYAQWERDSVSGRLLSLFTDDTATGNAILMSKVQAGTPNIFVRDAATMTLAQLQTRSPTFVITTAVAHDELLQQLNWFELFLKSTALA
jgi:hypothetical protein